MSGIRTEESLVIIYIAESFYVELHGTYDDIWIYFHDVSGRQVTWFHVSLTEQVQMLAREMPERVGGGSAPLTLNLLPVCKSAGGLPNLVCIPRTDSSRLFLVLGAVLGEFTLFFVQSVPEISSM